MVGWGLVLEFGWRFVQVQDVDYFVPLDPQMEAVGGWLVEGMEAEMEAGMEEETKEEEAEGEVEMVEVHLLALSLTATPPAIPDAFGE